MGWWREMGLGRETGFGIEIGLRKEMHWGGSEVKRG